MSAFERMFESMLGGISLAQIQDQAQELISGIIGIRKTVEEDHGPRIAILEARIEAICDRAPEQEVSAIAVPRAAPGDLGGTGGVP
jgi:hypothetical protein